MASTISFFIGCLVGAILIIIVYETIRRDYNMVCYHKRKCGKAFPKSKW